MCKFLLVIVVLVLFGGSAIAGNTWHEMYKGVGMGSDRDSACQQAQSHAPSSAYGACINRGGAEN